MFPSIQAEWGGRRRAPQGGIQYRFSADATAMAVQIIKITSLAPISRAKCPSPRFHAISSPGERFYGWWTTRTRRNQLALTDELAMNGSSQLYIYS